jgi:hypothetical protein
VEAKREQGRADFPPEFRMKIVFVVAALVSALLVGVQATGSRFSIV